MTKLWLFWFRNSAEDSDYVEVAGDTKAQAEEAALDEIGLFRWRLGRLSDWHAVRLADGTRVARAEYEARRAA